MSENERDKEDRGSSESERADGEAMPGFLTREEYEQVGDEPDPLPQDFQVIDGGAGRTEPEAAKAGGTAEANPPESAAGETVADAPAGPDAAAEPTDAGRPAPTGAAAAAGAVGSFFSEGMASVREMSAARRAHAEAREGLAQMDRRIEEQVAELEHRRDIDARYDAIVEDETAR